MYVSALSKGFLIAFFSLILVACGNDEKKQAQEITAKLPGSTTLQVHASSLSVAQGQTVTIDVHYIDAVGIKTDVAADATYNIGDSQVLTQGSASNSFTAVGGGSTTVEVSYQDKTESLTIHVTPTLVSKIDIELNQSAKTAVGQKGQFRAIAYFADGTHDDISDRVRWESSNSLVIAFEGAGSNFVSLSSGKSFISVVVPESVGVLTVQGAKPGAGGGDNTPIPSAAPSSSTYSIEVTVSDTGLSDLHLHSSAGSKLVPGESTSMTANAVDSEGTVFDFSSTVSWSSSDSSVATISDQGKVMAVGAGAATITATHAGFSTTYAITVDAVTATALDIHLTTGTDVNLNGTQRLTVSAEYSDGSSRDVTSLAAWSSDDTSILTVANGGSRVGEVRGVAAGSATISAVLDGLSSSVTLTVLDEQPNGLVIRQVGGTVFEGTTLNFQAFAQFDSGREDNVTSQVTWSSSRSDVLNISNASGHEGEAHALVAGAAKISVAFKNYRAELPIVVESAAVTALALSPSSINIGEGKDAQIQVTATYANGATSDVTQSASYSPQTAGVVTAHNGTIHGVAAGQSTVSVQFSGKSATLSVDVHAAALQSLLISSDKASLEVNQHAQLTATGTLDNGLQVSETSNVKWTSSDLHIATVDAHGRLTAHGAGAVTISASLSAVTSNDITITVNAAPAAQGGGGTQIVPAGAGAANATGAVTSSSNHTGTVSPSTLPTLKTFSFNESSSGTILGTSSELHPGSGNCDGNVKPEDTIGSIAILARQQAGVSNPSCWTDGGFNYSNFPVKQGDLASGSGSSYDAYVIGRGEAPKGAGGTAGFEASKHFVAFKPPAAGQYDIYQFDGHFTKVGTINATNTDWQYTDIEASAITTSITLSFVSANDPAPSALHSISSDLQGAQIATNSIGDIYHYELAIPGGRTPLDLSEFTAGPADHTNRYGQNRYFHLVELSSGNLGIVWQDRNDYKVYLTSFDRRGTSTTVDLPTGGGKQYMLGAATSDGAGAIYYILLEAGNPDPNYNPGSDATKVLSVRAVKSDENGVSLAAAELNDPGNSRNATTFGDIPSSPTAVDGKIDNTVSIRVAGGEVGIIYSRLHAQTSDGLNHQGADAIVLNSSNMTLKQDWRQTSGHSFSNVMETTSMNEFIAIDLGDNYPRGVHFHRFNGATKHQRVVFTFKTHHGYVASHDGRGPYDPLGIDVTGKQMFKWSNDNNTYTELGGLAEVSDGYVVVFAAEHDAQLHVLNNNSTGDNLYLIDPRNIGFVKVSANFVNASGSGNVVTDDLIVTQGGSSPETGEFYSFDGDRQEQRVTGIRWLTSYADKDAENASRVRLRDRADGNLLVLWEKWKPSDYVSTHAMVIDSNGAIVTQDTQLDGVRLNRRDDLFRIGNRTYSVIGNRASQSFEITEIEE